MTITIDLTFVSLEGLKVLDEIMAENIPNLSRDIKFQTRESEQIYEDKLKEIHTKTHHHQILKNKDKEKS